MHSVNDMNEKLQRCIEENSILKHEVQVWSETCQKIGIEREELQKRYDELLGEVAFLRGQVQAFTYCLGKNIRKEDE